MALVPLALTLLLVLSIARRLVDPACPQCAAKSWRDEPASLACTRCGWALVRVAAPAPDSRAVADRAA